MATGILVNSHTPHRSALDQAADRILAKAKLPLGESDARSVVEALEKMLEPRYSMDMSVRRRCFRGLVKLCGEYSILPSSHIIPESKIQKLGDSPISSGGSSEVWPGIHEDEKDEDGGKSVAIKVIRYWDSGDVQIKRNFYREVITWKRLSHPNILGLIGVMIDGEKQHSMVSPWMDNGTIVEFLREDHQANPLKLLEDATRGLQYLHSMDLAHGDLKGGNILISEEGRACLADVGLTRVSSDLTAATSTSGTNGTVTARWCPRERLYPEMFGSESSSGPIKSSSGLTKKSDIYSMAMTIYEVLVDRIPFYEYSDYTAMLHIIQGDRPKKPFFSITRGYTQELWDMTSCCWDVEPTKRPTVDRVLNTLIIAAEQWEPGHGGLSTQDDQSSTASEDESDPPTDLESEDEVVDNTSSSLDPPQLLIIETPVPSPPSVSPPSTVKDPTQLESTPTIPKKEETKSAPAIPPKEGKEPTPSTVISRKEMKPTFVRLPGEEGHKPVPVPSNDGDIRVAPVVPPKQEDKPKLAPVTSRDKVAGPAPYKRSREEEPRPTPTIPTKPLHARHQTEEESKPTLAISKKDETQHPPPSLPEAQLKRAPAASKDEIKEAVPFRPTPSAPRKGDTNPALVTPLKEVSPEPNPATPRKEATSSTTISSRKQELPSRSTPSISLGDDGHTSIDASKVEMRSKPIQKEAMSIINSPGKEEVFRPASNRGETESVSMYPRRVEPQVKEGPTGWESNPRRCPGHVHR